MSLARIALRIAAVEAIKGRTLVNENVLDSPNGALDIQADGTMRSEEDRPFVSVFTDSGEATGITGRSLIDNGSCVLVIEAGVSLAMTETDPDTAESHIIGVSIPASDRGFEFTLDVVHRQIVDALSDPENEWAEIYRGLHYRVTKVEVGGRRNADDGQRLAGRQIRIHVDLMEDPVLGEPIDPASPLAAFLAKLQASDDAVYQAQAATMLSLVGGNDPDWKTSQRRLGRTAAEMLALGLGPIKQDVQRETPEYASQTIEIEGVAGVREIT